MNNYNEYVCAIYSICLDSRLRFASAHFLSLSFFFFFFLSVKFDFSTHALFTRFRFSSTECTVQYYSCTVHRTHKHFIQKKKIKNRSHDTIHTFKNYFVTVFSVFSKISCIQMDS